MVGLGKGFGVSYRFLLFVSLLCVVLVSSLVTSSFVNVSVGASLENTVYVKNEEELKNAINNMFNKKALTITLDNDIVLAEELKIPADRDITLVSNKITGFYKLIGAEYRRTVFVDGGGVLKLDGIIVTHTKPANSVGGGVYVEEGGRLVLYSGEISDNHAVDGGGPFSSGAAGGGVCNFGVFEMHGGKILGNHVTGMGSSGGGSGGGVFNVGVFTMFGGEIANNIAHVSGGGVHNTGVFTMSGGEIINNHAENWGGGVSTFGTFERLGGVISGNTAGVNGNNIHPDDYNSDSSNGNGNDSNGGSSNSSAGLADDKSFSLRSIILTCIGILVIVIGIVIAVLFVYFKKKIAQVEAKLNTLTQDSTEK